ncbi:hypothetical protein [Shouchella lonarensis]|uniref:hypothetical protein n=1 Tax=Shouchella lonarensis TaxID=1464122 RepID=UPI001C409FE7|nr:hypothetical protein [Shouchella lonarensis]
MPEGFVKVLYGSSKNGFDLLSFLVYIVMNYGFIYFIQLLLQREVTSLGYYKILRFRSVYVWLWLLLKKVMRMSVLFLVCLFLVITVGYYIYTSNGSFSYSSQLDVEIVSIIYHFFVNGFLQLLLYSLLSFFIMWISKEMFYGFLTLFVLSVSMFPGMNPGNIIPVGLNSMGYLIDGVPLFQVTLILLLCIIGIMAILIYVTTKSDFNP